LSYKYSFTEITGETIADATNRSRDELRRFMMFDVVWSLSNTKK